MKRSQQLAIAAVLLISTVKAAPPTSWDNMLQDVTIDGQATVVTKDGKKHKSEGVSFSLTGVRLPGEGTISRQDVKEVVIRQKWDECCEALWLGAALVYEGGKLLGHGDESGVAAIILGLPVAAVTLPPALVIQAFRHWTTHVSYKVVP